VKRIYSTLLLGILTFTGCGGGGGGSSKDRTPPMVNNLPQPRISSNDGKIFDPFNLYGYTIKYSEYYINYSLSLGCDGSYMMNAMRRAIAMPSEYGDTMEIVGDKMRFGHLVSFTLIDGNLVVGQSRDATLGGIITSITQTKVCN